MLSQRLSRVARVPRPRQTPLEIPTQSNPGRHTQDGETRLINWHAENAGKEGKTPFPIYAVDGFSDFATLTGGGACRGLFATDATLYVVSGRLCFAVDQGGGVSTLGGVPDDGPVFFSRNRAEPTQIVLTTVAGLKYTITDNVLAEITDPDLGTPNGNDFINGFTLYGTPSGRIYYSALDEADDIDANDFFEAEGNPDGLTRVFVHKLNIFALGKAGTELFQNVEDANNPFQRVPGGVFSFGCLAPASVCAYGENIILADEHGRIILANGAGASKVISTPAVERAINALSAANKALLEGFVRYRSGHKEYVLSGTNFTWVHDEQFGWYERKSQSEDRWRAACYAKFSDKHIVGDFEQGKLYQITESTYDEAGTPISAVVRIPVHAWPNSVTVTRVRVDMVVGVGLNSASLHSSNPEISLRVSRDGGVTYGNSYSRSIGKIGQRKVNIEFSKNGDSEFLGTSGEDGFILEFTVSSPVIRAIMGITTDAKVVTGKAIL